MDDHSHRATNSFSDVPGRDVFTSDGVKADVDAERAVAELLAAPSGIQACQAIASVCAERPQACSATPLRRLPIRRNISAIAATCVIISRGT